MIIPANSEFHTLVASRKYNSRIRMYFISDDVDFTRDAAVEANGELLIRDAGDTDSNKRVSQDGFSLTRYHNKETDYKIGDTVSNVLSVTFLNDDGGLDGFDFTRRCKVYLDAQDPATGTWYNCPIGVFRFEKPVKQRVQLIHATAYDIMQELNVIADSWWNNLDFSGGITLGGLGQQIAAVIDTSMTFGLISNSSVSYTSRPFTAVEMTYRDILALLAEAMSVNIRLTATGIMRAASWNSASHTIDCDTEGSGVISIDMAEYTVPAIDRLRVLATESSNSADIGSGDNVYDIVENPLLFAPDVNQKATAIYNRLHTLPSYKPVSARVAGDWSIEPCDLITIKYQGTTYYSVPIFQQTITWHGGLVYIDFFCTGSASRPVMSKMGRAEFRDAKTVHTIENTADTLASRINDFDGSGSTIEQTVDSISTEVASKVGDNEIISKINQSPEQITIQANKLSLLGYTTINDGFKVNLDGTFEANGATINGSLKTKSGTKSVEMTSGMLKFVRSGNTLFSMDYDSDFGGISLNANTNNGVRQVEITGAGGPSSGIRLYDTDGTTIIGEMTCSGALQVGTSAGNKLTYDPVNGLTADGGATIVGNTTVFGGISATGNITSRSATVSGDATVSGNATINGVLDVAQRRCYATLSSAGWYRILQYNASTTDAQWSAGVKIDITITTSYGNTNNSLHAISMLGVYRWVDFVNETSYTNTTTIDKIRYVYGTDGNGYIDLHYNSNAGNSVAVDFNVHYDPRYAGDIVSVPMTAVGDPLTNGTVMKEHNFVANTYGGMRYYRQSVSSITIGSDGFATMTTPSQIVGRKLVNIMLSNCSTISGGAMSILSYSDANGYARSNYYMAGSAGASMTNAVIEFWYL